LLHRQFSPQRGRDLVTGNFPRFREVPGHPERAPESSLPRIHHIKRLDRGAAVMQIGGENIQYQHDHTQIGAGHFDEQVRVSDAHLPDVSAVDNGRKGEDLGLRVAQERIACLVCQDRRVFLAFGVNLQNFAKRHRLLIAQRAEGYPLGIGQHVPNRKRDGPESVQPDRHCSALPAEDLRKLLLCLNELCEALVRDGTAARLTGGDKWTHPLQAFLNQHLIVAAFAGFDVGISARSAFQLAADLSGDTLDAPEIRTVGVLQFNLELSSSGVDLLHFAFDQWEPGIKLFLTRPAADESIKIAAGNGDRRHGICAQYWTRLERIISRSAEKRLRMSWISSATIAMRSRPNPHAMTGTSTPSGCVTSGRKSPAPPSSIQPR